MDREKVIKAAEICLRYINDGNCPTECPYFDLCTRYEKRVVFQPLIRDALALLKEQEEQEEQIKNRDESLEKARGEIKWLRGMLKEQNDCENCAIAIEDRQLVIRCEDCGNKKHWEAGNVVCGIDGKPHRPDYFCAYCVKLPY